MELCWLRILTGLFLLRKAHASVSGRIIRAPGQQATLPCESASPQTRWFWQPQSSRCAQVRRGYVEITWNLWGHRVAPPRFSGRLTNQASGSLVLRNLVMSDSGTYVCYLFNGSETLTILEVTTGCHNNLFVSFWWLNASSLWLSCRHCQLPGRFKATSFRWRLNSQPLGNQRWFKKSNFGSIVELLSTPREAWGRWECYSLANDTWVSEICLQPPSTEKDEGSASADLLLSLEPSLWPSLATAKTTDVAPTEAGRAKGTEIWIWHLLCLGLALVPAALGTAVWVWKRQLAARKQRGRKERTGCASVRNPVRANEEVSGRRSLDEGLASLHYAQLEYPRRKSTSAWTRDNTTVYAVIV